MNNYKVLQMTNSAIGAVAVNAPLPLGAITRRIQNNCNTPTIEISSSSADTLYINDAGNYNISYSASLVAAAAGLVTVTLVVNGVTVYAVSETAAAGGTVNLMLPYQIRVCPNGNTVSNIPASVQIILTAGAATGGTSNTIVEKVY